VIEYILDEERNWFAEERMGAVFHMSFPTGIVMQSEASRKK
jgi:hypothetical protein